MEMTQGEHHQYVYRPVSASQAMRSRVAGSEADCETAIGWVVGRVFYFVFFFFLLGASTRDGPARGWQRKFSNMHIII